MNQTLRLHVNNEIPAYRPGLVSALDVGTSKVVCVIGQAEAGSLKVLGSSLRESSGLKAGTITSLDQAEESIRDCVAAAENMADARIQNVLISVNCGQPVSVTSRAVMSLDGALVSDDHLRVLLSDGRARAKLEGHEVIQSAPTAYVVDEARGVKNPSGMFCQRIGVAMHAVAVKPSPLQNLKLAVERCHLNVIGTQFGAYASGISTLTEDEKQIGATVIDMGGGTTSIAVFLEGHLVHADVVPVGGFAVTSDIGMDRRPSRPSPRPWPPPNAPRRSMARRWARWTAVPTWCRSPRPARRATMPPCACRAPCSLASSKPVSKKFSARCRPVCARRVSTWRRAAARS